MLSEKAQYARFAPSQPSTLHKTGSFHSLKSPPLLTDNKPETMADPNTQWARISYCWMGGSGEATSDFYSAYCKEILQHSGLCFDEVARAQLPLLLPHQTLLITAGEGVIHEELANALMNFMEQGGVWIAIGCVYGKENLFGVQLATPPPQVEQPFIRLGAGYALFEGFETLFAHLKTPLRFFGGVAVEATTAEPVAALLDCHQNPTPFCAVARQRWGKGEAILIAPNLGETLVRIQMGACVHEDGIAPSDGTAPLNDGVLRCEDGIMLDWRFDRSPDLEGLPLFQTPVTDHWREVLIRLVLQASQRAGLICPLIWHYPRHQTGAGVLTVETSSQLPDSDQACNRLLTLVGIKATWGVQHVAQTQSFYRELQKRDNEIALIYEPADPQELMRYSSLQMQLDHVRRFTSVRTVNAVQIQGLQWRGKLEFYEQCERVGLSIDINRGGYAPGAAGFAFGGCQPWRPLRRDGALSNLYVLPLLGYQIGSRLSMQTARDLVDQAAEVYGVAHFTVNTEFTALEQQADTLLKLLAHARSRGLEWTTASELIAWEESRRQLRYRLAQSQNGLQMGLVSPKTINNLSLLFLTPEPMHFSTGVNELSPQTVERYGMSFQAIQVDVLEKSLRELTLTRVDSQAA